MSWATVNPIPFANTAIAFTVELILIAWLVNAIKINSQHGAAYIYNTIKYNKTISNLINKDMLKYVTLNAKCDKVNK